MQERAARDKTAGSEMFKVLRLALILPPTVLDTPEGDSVKIY